jgi:molybdate transport system ATP-binding protein
MTLKIAAKISSGLFVVDVHYEARPGITALFGPSGSGKSVSLAAVAGLLRPQSGTISFNEQQFANAEKSLHVRTQDRKIGMVSQNAALLSHLSPLENVAIALLNSHDRAQRQERASHWLGRVQAEHLAKLPTASLSGGEQQRVALARALAGAPQLLLLDEPFSALDQTSRIAVRSLIIELVAELKLTAIIVTHDLIDVAALANQLVLFEPGRTVVSHELIRGQTAELARLVGLTI